MAESRSESSDSDASHLAQGFADLLTDLVRRDLVLVRAQGTPPPTGAWAPAGIAIQAPLSGRIEVGIPDAQGTVEWRIIDRRHLLVVCPGGWSPRTHRHARRHLAMTCGDPVHLSEWRTPVGGSRTGRPFAEIWLREADPLLTQAIETLRGTIRGRAHAAVIQGCVTAVLALAARSLQRVPEDPQIQTIRTWLREHCSDALQRDTVARRFRISGDHLTRLLRQRDGEGFVDTLQRYRLDRVTDLLRQDKASIADIAAQTGFGSPSYLIRVFRRHHGQTPEAWRRAWRASSDLAT